ncbi:hypothetical protein GCM10009657_13130 [Oryzihumus leptocrescens]
MHRRRSGRAQLDLTGLSPEVRAVVESLIDDGEVDITRSGEPVGTLAFTSTVLHGAVLPPDPPGRTGQGSPREGVVVVATTMLMSDAARRRLSDAFGPDYLVLDFLDAPSTADIVLTQPVSPQLTHRWTLMFPQAQVIITEILDPEFGLDVSGPVGRLLDAGAHVYLPPRPVEQVAENVLGYLAAQARPELGSAGATRLELGTDDGAV